MKRSCKNIQVDYLAFSDQRKTKAHANIKALGLKSFLLVVLVVFSTAALQKKTEDLEKLEKAAASGDSVAQLRLGNAYYFGRRGAEVDYDLAFKWYKRASDSGSVSALFNLGLCYDCGHGTKKNEFKAFECYKEAAEVGLPQAKFNLALLYYRGVRDASGKTQLVPRNAKLAKKLLRELCDREFTPAYRELGKIFLDSQKKSEQAKARPLLAKAAANGDAIAMNLLSDCFSKGVGTDKNEEESIKWLKKASANGSIEATGKLAYRYENGDGVERDQEKALEFYKMAAIGGLPVAQAKLGDYYAFGQGGIERNIPEAKKWYARAAIKQNPKALFYLATFAMQGIGEKKDVDKAAKLFILAARLGEPHAQYNLAKFLMKGEGVKKNPAIAVHWFRMAALQGDPKSQRELAFCLIQGKGTKEDYQKGVRWLKLASENGDAPALKFMRDTGISP